MAAPSPAGSPTYNSVLSWGFLTSLQVVGGAGRVERGAGAVKGDSE